VCENCVNLCYSFVVNSIYTIPTMQRLTDINFCYKELRILYRYLMLIHFNIAHVF
jgi:hypothetical protein